MATVVNLSRAPLVGKSLSSLYFTAVALCRHRGSELCMDLPSSPDEF